MLFFYIVFLLFLISDLLPLIKGKLKKEAVIYSVLALAVGISAGIYYIFIMK